MVRAMKTKQRKSRRSPDPALLADIVKRVVGAARPRKIVLFGSGARGTMGPHSDIDLLVIKGGKFNYWRVLTSIYRSLRGPAQPLMWSSSHPRTPSAIATAIVW